MPEAKDAAGASPEPQRPPATTSQPPLEWTGRGEAAGRQEPDTLAEATPNHRPDPELRVPVHGADHRDAVPLRGTRGLAAWIVFGLGVAAALVAAAVLLRPDPVVPVAEPAAVPQAEADAVTETAPVSPVPETETGIVRLRVGPDADPVEITRITEALKASGVGPIRVETLPFAITQSRVGYYRPEDETAADALAELAGPLIGNGEVGLRDYGDLLADTEPGRLDLWLGD
jgi:hypothetical protein